jgi:hypothetical protein
MNKVYIVAHGTREKVWYKCDDPADPDCDFVEQFNWLCETQAIFVDPENAIDYMIKRAKESIESLRAKRLWQFFTREIVPWEIAEGEPVFYAIDDDGWGYYLSYKSYEVE